MNASPSKSPGIQPLSILSIVLTLAVLGVALWNWAATRDWIAHNVFWTFALLPAFAAIVNYFLTVPRRLEARLREASAIRAVQRTASPEPTLLGYSKRSVADSATLGPAPQKSVGSDSNSAVPPKAVQTTPLSAAEAVEQHQPFSAVLFGALCLAAVYSVPALISEADLGVGVDRSRQASPTPTATPARPPGVSPNPADPPALSDSPSVPSPTMTPTATPTITPASESKAGVTRPPAVTPTPQPDSAPRIPNPTEGRNALLYAAYGSYVYMARLFISRLNSSSLTGKFLLRMAFNASVAMVLGFAAGETGAFKAVASGTQSLFLYLALGMFPGWAALALRKKARDIFQPPEQGCESLPLCLIDGLDDETVDRLAELGFWDIQHLACSDPVDVAVRSLYPSFRVVDWIDQSILIFYVRSKVTFFRALGVRGAIDLALLYEDGMSTASTDPEIIARHDRALKLFEILSQKSEIPKETILVIGRYFYEDHTVDVLWRLWQEADMGAATGDISGEPGSD